jgi:hypothetical protein
MSKMEKIWWLVELVIAEDEEVGNYTHDCKHPVIVFATPDDVSNVLFSEKLQITGANFKGNYREGMFDLWPTEFLSVKVIGLCSDGSTVRNESLEKQITEACKSARGN